ncbi:protocadherin-11 X-linked-like [Littorina saxatilis]|uniref:protocadherin-11 X-linked-like n=1 Tax=Littorina saxatilis TaxID=31220 RepID=UPI0038B532CC
MTRTLSFLNPNKAPAFSAIPTVVSIPEDVTSGSTLVTFSVTDTQPFSRTFTVDSDPSFFDWNLTSGEVNLAAGQLLNYEAERKSYVITCVADDTFFQSTASVTVSVVDVNDAPVLSPASLAITVEEGPPSSLSARLPLTVTDDDGTSATSHAFSLRSHGNHSNLFTFPDPHSPVLTNLLTLDAESDDPPFPAILEVVVMDTGGKTATAKVIVTLSDVNDNDPVFLQDSLTMKTVYVGMAAGTSLGQVVATDADEGGSQGVELSLLASDAHPHLVTVQHDGQVALTQTLPTEDYGTLLTVKVKATDKGSPQRSSTVVLTLYWNKAPSILNLPANADVPEDPSLEKLLITLVTSDPENDTVTCQVSDVTPQGTGSGAFVVRNVAGASGQAVYYNTAEDLSRAVASAYDVTVTASDGKGGQSSQVLTVEVTPNTPPVWSCQGSVSASVDVQNAKVGDEVHAFTVTDRENDTIFFTMTSSPDSGSFRFDEGKIYSYS